MIDPNKVRLATHYARLTDPSASPDLAFAAARAAADLLVTDDEPIFVGTDKDNYHSNLLRAWLEMRGGVPKRGGVSMHKIIKSVILEPAFLDLYVKNYVEEYGQPPKSRSKTELKDEVTDVLCRLVGLHNEDGKAPRDREKDRVICLRTIDSIPASSNAGGASKVALPFLRSVLDGEGLASKALNEDLRHKYESIKGSAAASRLAPLRQHLKQIVLPGPNNRDVVVTPLTSMPLSGFLADLVSVSKEHYWRRRFIRKNAALGNQQNTGIIGNWYAFNYRLGSWRLMSTSIPLSEEYIEELINTYIEKLVKAIFRRRMYMQAQGLDIKSQQDSRRDLNLAVIHAAADIARWARNHVQDVDLSGLDDITMETVLYRMKLRYKGSRLVPELHAPETKLIKEGVRAGLSGS